MAQGDILITVWQYEGEADKIHIASDNPSFRAVVTNREGYSGYHPKLFETLLPVATSRPATER